MYRHLLVPLDGTPLAHLLTEQALALARTLNARVSFVHVQPDFAGTQDGATLHSVAPETYRQCATGNAHAIVARAAAAAHAAQVVHDTHIVVAPQPAPAILDTARQLACDLVVLASHGRRGWEALRAGSVSRRLLAQAWLPVLVTAVEPHLAQDDAARAIGLIRAEHRSMAAVLHGLLKVWREARTASRLPDLALLGAMLYYIEHFPERLHHPKEDAHLFVRLRQRTATLNALIDQLQAQHAQGSAQFAALRADLAALRAGQGGAAERLDRSLEDFVQGQWQHMADEERLVLPAAQQHLQPADWQAIATAFGENGDPRFDTREGAAFEELFTRVLRLAALPRESASESQF